MLSRLYLQVALCSFCLPLMAAERYQIDSEHTYSSFEYQHWGLSTQRGRFDKNTGSIELDLASKTGAVNLEIDTDSVSTGSDLFNKALRSESFFDAGNHPKIFFSSDQFVFTEDKLSQIKGNLRIRDITRRVTIDITQFNCRFMVLYLKQACGANGYTKILRSDYKIGRYVPFVSDEVTLFFSVEAIKE